MNARIKKIRNLIRSLKLDALLISNPSNIFYLSGFYGEDSYLLVTRKECFIITDFRYKEEAEEAAGGLEIITEGLNLNAKTASLVKRFSLKRIGFESTHLTVAKAKGLQALLKKKLIPLTYTVEKIRIIKDKQEIRLIRKAASISKAVLKQVTREIKPGQSEKDIAARIDFLLKKKGADGLSFKTIAASGANASMPHARPGARRVKGAEPIILDFGARFKGYSSDLTRTHFVGKIDKHFKLIYSIVKTAQAKAIEKVAPGVKISEIDKAARNYITKKGFGKFFGHAVGHSIGIDTHEAPAISLKNNQRLKKGMVFTIEPGIYLPGKGGVRIEDMVLVTEKGYQVLTR